MVNNPENLQRLDEYTKDEWRTVAKYLVPNLTDEQYDVMWDEFVEMKRMKGLN
jgi:hypothetical protein